MPIVIQGLRSVAGRVVEWSLSAGVYLMTEAILSFLWEFVKNSLSDLSDDLFAVVWADVREAMPSSSSGRSIPHGSEFNDIEDWLDDVSERSSAEWSLYDLVLMSAIIAWRSRKLSSFLNMLGHMMTGTAETDTDLSVDDLLRQPAGDLSPLVSHVQPELMSLSSPTVLGPRTVLDADANGQLSPTEHELLKLASRRVCSRLGLNHKGDLRRFLDDLRLMQVHGHLLMQ